MGAKPWIGGLKFESLREHWTIPGHHLVQRPWIYQLLLCWAFMDLEGLRESSSLIYVCTSMGLEGLRESSYLIYVLMYVHTYMHASRYTHIHTYFLFFFNSYADINLTLNSDKIWSMLVVPLLHLMKPCTFTTKLWPLPSLYMSCEPPSTSMLSNQANAWSTILVKFSSQNDYGNLRKSLNTNLWHWCREHLLACTGHLSLYSPSSTHTGSPNWFRLAMLQPLVTSVILEGL